MNKFPCSNNYKFIRNNPHKKWDVNYIYDNLDIQQKKNCYSFF